MGDHGSPPRLRFQRPWLPEGDRIEAYLARSREVRWFSNGGPCWDLLRTRLAERVGARCVPVASATAGLVASIAAVIDRVPGRGEALVPSFTFPATAQAAAWNGLRPRLLDVDPDHWHLDPTALERALARHRGDVAVVVAVSSFGTPPPADVRARWEQACAEMKVPLVVDSAAGFGAVADDGVPIGAQGDVEVVSFHATKPFAVGEGGAVFTRDDRLRARIEEVINFGFGADHVVTTMRAINGKLSELHAAAGLAVLDEFDAILAARRAAASRVRDASRPGLGWQRACERSTWQFVPVRFEDRAARDDAASAFAPTLETRVYYEPLHRMPAIAGAVAGHDGLEITEDLADRVLALPMANDLSEPELDLLCEAVAAEPRAVSMLSAERRSPGA